MSRLFSAALPNDPISNRYMETERARVERYARLRALPIEDVAGRLGILRLRRNMRCPLPDHEDRHPSCTFLLERNRWRCFGCGRGGSVLDLVMHMRGVSLEQAVAWLDSGLNGAGPFGDRCGGRLLLTHASKQSAAASASDPEVYEALMSMAPLSSSSIAYLWSRGFGEATSRHFQLGSLVSAPSAFNWLTSRYGVERLRRAGLVVSSNQNRRLVFAAPSILFPFWEQGRIVYIQSRSLPAARAPRWIGLAGVSQPVFNAQIVRCAQSLLICEGATDVLAAHEMGLVAIGLLGAERRLPLDLIHQLRGKKIRIATDNDLAGVRLAMRVHEDLLRAGVASEVKPPPRGHDLADCLRLIRDDARTPRTDASW